MSMHLNIICELWGYPKDVQNHLTNFYHLILKLFLLPITY